MVGQNATNIAVMRHVITYFGVLFVHLFICLKIFLNSCVCVEVILTKEQIIIIALRRK